MKADLDKILDAAPPNLAIQNTLMRMDLKLDQYHNPVCSVSGGSDSDMMIEVIERVRGDRPVRYVFFDTGIEYQATKRQLNFLEQKYEIEIDRQNAVVPVPLGCKRHGLPFLTKRISEYIERLQRHGFQWEDEPFEVLHARYPKCKAALRWWCNGFSENKRDKSKFNISEMPYLKEFMIANPPRFKISKKCCDGAKEKTGRKYDKTIKADLKILGLRQAEGGARSTGLSSCFSAASKKDIANYRPLFFWSDNDKEVCKSCYHIVHSDCYEVWGMTRTGCAGCPFGSRFEDELQLIAKYEPRLLAAINNIFGASYEYTRAYRAYRDRRKAEAKGQVQGQTMLIG